MAKELLIEKLSGELSEMIERAAPSIVLVQSGRDVSAGIVWQKNVVVTADHAHPRAGEAQIHTQSGETITASVAGRDPSIDIALLKIASDLQPVEIAADPSLKAGQLAVSLGRARGGRLLSVLAMISGTEGAYRNWRGGTLDHFVRLDIGPFPGFSGSALLLPGGKVAGMNTSVFSRHFGLTVPASNIERLVQRLSTTGSVGKPYIGIMMQPIRLPDKMREHGEIGLLVMGTENASPAEIAGLMIGDIVVGFNEKTVHSMEELHALLNTESIGKELNIKVLRGGIVQNMAVKIGERPLRNQNE